MDKTVNINNFIGVYDGYITSEECERAIKLFEDEDKMRKTLNRSTSEKAPTLMKQDQQYFCTADQLDLWWKDLNVMIFNFEHAFKHYIEKTGAGAAYNDVPFHKGQLKLQKTLPTEGYHIWHVEYGKGYHLENRAFAYTIYLNDVKEGGETEFLHFSKRVKPKKGRIVIWPAAFPYVHRGNPPLSGKKYILTSWMNIRGI
jgi:hypothetical protein